MPSLALSMNPAWAHWYLNDDAVKGIKPIDYADLVHRTGVKFLPNVDRAQDSK